VGIRFDVEFHVACTASRLWINWSYLALRQRGRCEEKYREKDFPEFLPCNGVAPIARTHGEWRPISVQGAD
jgi:hypothetical protein